MTIESIELKPSAAALAAEAKHKEICDAYKVLRAKYCEAPNTRIELTIAELMGYTQQGIDRILRKYNVLKPARKRKNVQ